MQALNMLDAPLQWETERQNRIHREAVEQKKRQSRGDDARREPAVAVAASRALPADVVAPTHECADKVFHIPDMRSALMFVGDAAEGDEWSKPFSLFKADMQPWLSFLKGYNASRLFLEIASTGRGEAIVRQDHSQIDFAVRALLALKQASVNIILEPPVQINSQVEYHDLEDELRVSRDPAQARALVRRAEAVHEKQLAQAVAKGRQMGNLLYDALMGEGHVNLIRAWEKVHQRKPTVEELHLMLTTGRVRLERRAPAAIAQERPPQQPAIVARKEAALPKPPEALVAKEMPSSPQVAMADNRTTRTGTTAAPESEPVATHHRRRKLLMYLFHVTLCSAALVAYAWVMM